MMLLLDPDAQPVVAHRGDSAHAPENTLEALLQGAALGVDALEFDVRLTRDGHAVVIHDATVDRTTDGTGPVAGLTLDQIQRLDAGFGFTPDGGRSFPWRGRGVTIPALDSVLGAFPAMPIIVEIKAVAASLETKRLLERHDATGRCAIGSFSDATVAPFRGSGIAFFAVRRDVVRLYARALAPGSPKRLPYDALCIPPAFRGLPLPVLRMARMAHHCGVPTHLWTVDDPARARRYWDGGVNAIISNDPAAILAAAGRSRGAHIPVPVS
ncbi:MAG TPA: glycerophosphodiester phosphodiesterase [Gemmatimonadaceae bacterium]|nr:glycerophosphodiester phosphodiesterase [Gemmatimonadaceae bacterium]